MISVSFFLAFSEQNVRHHSENQYKGAELCDQIYNTLVKKGYSPESQSLVSSGTNIYPYNILISFSAIEETSENLVIIFPIESFYNAQNLILQTADYIKNSNFSFDTTILLSYGDNQIPQKSNTIKGTQYYVETLPSSNDITAILINTESEENSITNSSESMNSPSWLIKNAYDVYKKNNLPNSLDSLYISQIHQYNIIKTPLLETLFDLGIPSIQLDFNYDENKNEEFSQVLNDYIDLYSKTTVRNWDQHCILIKIFNRTILISETILVQMVILASFIIMLSFFFYIFSHKNSSKRIWKLLKRVWFIPFFVLFQIFLFFFLSCSLTEKLYTTLHITNRIFFIFLFLITFVFIITIVAYQNFLYVGIQYIENALDMEIMVLSFINLLVFSLYDLTLFPIFLSIFVFSYLNTYIFKKTSGILILFFFVLTYIPYINAFLFHIDIKKVEDFLLHDITFLISISMVITPIFLLILRIITFYNHKKYNTYVSIMILYIAFTSSLLIYTTFNTGNISAQSGSKTIMTVNDSSSSDRSSKIKISYSDKYIFSDIIRTVDITFDEQPVQCDVQVSGPNIPILYSDNDFFEDSDYDCSFIIPYYPPKKMRFNYGTTLTEGEITVTAIFETDDENSFLRKKESIKIQN